MGRRAGQSDGVARQGPFQEQISAESFGGHFSGLESRSWHLISSDLLTYFVRIANLSRKGGHSALMEMSQT